LDHELAVSKLDRKPNRLPGHKGRGRRSIFRFLALNMTFRALQVYGAGFCDRQVRQRS
jgi:hypothetical protein